MSIIQIDGINCSSSIWTVSYTHLDVYKRQGLTHAVFALGTNDLGHPGPGGAPEEELITVDQYAAAARTIADALHKHCLLYTSRPLQAGRVNIIQKTSSLVKPLRQKYAKFLPVRTQMCIRDSGKTPALVAIRLHFAARNHPVRLSASRP